MDIQITPLNIKVQTLIQMNEENQRPKSPIANRSKKNRRARRIIKIK